MLINYFKQYKENKNCHSVIDSPYSKICRDLDSYSIPTPFDIGYVQMEDKQWVDSSFCELCGGFDHIENYDNLRKMTEFMGNKVNIIDSFLVLESFENSTVQIAHIDKEENIYDYVDGKLKLKKVKRSVLRV